LSDIVYADVHGDIAYHATGTAPKRTGHHSGLNAVPGWTGEYEWTGEYIPPAEFPHGVNPSKGFVHSCNHKIVSDDFPHYLGKTWMNGYRGRRIEELLSAKSKHSLKDFADYQHDVKSIPGQDFVAAVKHHLGAPTESRFASLPADVQAAARALYDWDLFVRSDSVGASIYEVARFFVVRNLAEPSLGAELADLLVGKGTVPLLKLDNEYFGYDTVSILRMLDPKATKQSWWLEQAGGADKLLTTALSGAATWLKRELGDDVKEWKWGRIHQWPFPHGLAEIKPLDQVFSLKSIPVGGDTDTLLQMAFAPEEPYDAACWTPSTQLLYDVGNWSRSVWKFYPGNSGNLGSLHYNDFHKKLLTDVQNGEPRIEVSAKKHYVPMLWTNEEILASMIAELTMNPN
jgi:penicillin G amidase